MNWIEKLNALSTYIGDGKAAAMKISGNELVLVIGVTGAGKSVLFNYLMNIPLRVVNNDGVVDTQIDVVDTSVKGASTIGNRNTSETILPTFGKLDGTNMVFCDCPGFFDNREMEISLANAVIIREILHAAGGVKIILLVDYSSMLCGRQSGVSMVTPMIVKLFQSTDVFQEYSQSVMIGISKIPVGESKKGFYLLKEAIEASPDEHIRCLAKNIFIFDPLDRNLIYKQRSSREDLIKRFKELPSIGDTGIVFHTSLSDTDIRRVTEVFERLDDEVQMCLENNDIATALKHLETMKALKILQHRIVDEAFYACLDSIERHKQGVVSSITSKIRDRDFETVENLMRQLVRLEQNFKDIATDSIKTICDEFQRHVRQTLYEGNYEDTFNDTNSLKHLDELQSATVEGTKQNILSIIQEHINKIIENIISKIRNAEFKTVEIPLNKLIQLAGIFTDEQTDSIKIICDEITTTVKEILRQEQYENAFLCKNLLKHFSHVNSVIVENAEREIDLLISDYRKQIVENVINQMKCGEFKTLKNRLKQLVLLEERFQDGEYDSIQIICDEIKLQVKQLLQHGKYEEAFSCKHLLKHFGEMNSVTLRNGEQTICVIIDENRQKMVDRIISEMRKLNFKIVHGDLKQFVRFEECFRDEEQSAMRVLCNEITIQVKEFLQRGQYENAQICKEFLTCFDVLKSDIVSCTEVEISKVVRTFKNTIVGSITCSMREGDFVKVEHQLTQLVQLEENFEDKENDAVKIVCNEVKNCVKSFLNKEQYENAFVCKSLLKHFDELQSLTAKTADYEISTVVRENRKYFLSNIIVLIHSGDLRTFESQLKLFVQFKMQFKDQDDDSIVTVCNEVKTRVAQFLKEGNYENAFQCKEILKHLAELKCLSVQSVEKDISDIIRHYGKDVATSVTSKIRNGNFHAAKKELQNLVNLRDQFKQKDECSFIAAWDEVKLRLQQLLSEGQYENAFNCTSQLKVFNEYDFSEIINAHREKLGDDIMESVNESNFHETKKFLKKLKIFMKLFEDEKAIYRIVENVEEELFKKFKVSMQQKAFLTASQSFEILENMSSITNKERGSLSQKSRDNINEYRDSIVSQIETCLNDSNFEKVPNLLREFDKFVDAFKNQADQNKLNKLYDRCRKESNETSNLDFQTFLVDMTSALVPVVGLTRAIWDLTSNASEADQL